MSNPFDNATVEILDLLDLSRESLGKVFPCSERATQKFQNAGFKILGSCDEEGNYTANQISYEQIDNGAEFSFQVNGSCFDVKKFTSGVGVRCTRR